MSTFQSIVLGIVQGITEFLPVSSSGHLNLLQFLFELKPSLALDIFLNTATFISVLFFFRSKVSYFFKNLPYIFIGSIPAALVGFFFKDKIEMLFSNPSMLPLFFLITATLVFSTKFIKTKDDSLDYKKAILIGLVQAVAILPGVSRSGSTIFAGLLFGLSPLSAFNYSFSLFIPASLGALLLGLKDLSGLSFSSDLIISFIITFVVGLGALMVVRRFVISKKFWIFGIYAAFISVVTFFLVNL